MPVTFAPFVGSGEGTVSERIIACMISVPSALTPTRSALTARIDVPSFLRELRCIKTARIWRVPSSTPPCSRSALLSSAPLRRSYVPIASQQIVLAVVFDPAVQTEKPVVDLSFVLITLIPDVAASSVYVQRTTGVLENVIP